ncbi:uncharacterized protein si:dkey-112e17.1 isoform X2 [Engraulis encrasicolus]|uniref:uncharacterized protein si:dkey-112e17.1 isoform X2 n=1 Tax=Engraulis encrasicolus TaxID=184585 RepID=UPI002FD1DD10
MGLNIFRRTSFFVVSFLFWITGYAPQKVYFDCGAKVDVVDAQGLILSPGFPYNYSSGTHCVWQFFVPVGHQLVMEMFDFDVFENHSRDNNQARFAAMSEGDLDDQEEIMDDSSVYSSTLGSEAVEEAEAEAGAGLKDLVTPTPGSSSMKGPQLNAKKDEVNNKPVVVQEESTKMELAKVSNSAKWSASMPPPLAASLLPTIVQAPGMVEAAGDKALNAISPQGLRAEAGLEADELASYFYTTTAAFPADTESVSPEMQQAQLDACPHDVLYISDLITFSSRFCGANRPSSSQLVFGSSDEMVEVIMELITTTHWGRGFALLFHYRNHTEGMADQRSLTPAASGKMGVLLAVVSGVAFFAVALAFALFVIFRPKLCAKGASASPSSNPEVPQLVQNPGVDVSELQLVPPNELAGQEAAVLSRNGNNNRSQSLSLLNTGLSFTVGGEASSNQEQDVSAGGLTELELGTDEVFVISSGPSPSRLPFCPHTRDRYLRHSDTGPSRVNDWPSTDPTAAAVAGGATTASTTSSSSSPAAPTGSSSSSSRPRAWSVRTFQDFLPPLPQLHKKWCSWNSTSPFTKLVDNAPSSSVDGQSESGKRKVFSDPQLGDKGSHHHGSQSDSSMSNASYPLAQPAQRQRRLNSASNLRRTRFAAPCFGLLSGSPEGNRAASAGDNTSHTDGSSTGHHHHHHQHQQQQSGESQPQVGKVRDFAGGGSDPHDHVSVPVFAICEEEDRQPLVQAEHLSTSSPSPSSSSSTTVVRNGLSQVKRLAEGGVPLLNGSVLSPRGKSEWRPWASNGTAEEGLLPSGDEATATAATAESPLVMANSLSGQIQLSSLSQ